MSTIILPIGDAIQKRGDTLLGFELQRIEDGVPSNLIGTNVRIRFRLSTDDTKTKEFNVGSGITILNPSTGWIRFEDIPSLDWEEGLWVGDVKYIFSDGTGYTDCEIQILVS
jgi:hypothetical protein